MLERMSTTTNRSLLIVHGRGFKPPEPALMEISLEALRAGIERDYPHCADAFDSLSKDMAYFGDLTHEVKRTASATILCSTKAIERTHWQRSGRSRSASGSASASTTVCRVNRHYGNSRPISWPRASARSG